MRLLKNGLKILLCAAVLVFVVFLIGRYGWKLLGFSVCESAGVETVEVTDDRVKIQASSPAPSLKDFVVITARSRTERSMWASGLVRYSDSSKQETLILRSQSKETSVK